MGLSGRRCNFLDNASDLDKVVYSLKTVCNTLFHGGKYNISGLNDEARATEFLTLGKKHLMSLLSRRSLMPIILIDSTGRF